MLAFIRERGPTHPRLVEEHFAHGRRINAWGGSGLATTHLLDGMHYRGLLRVQRRDNGTRIYAAVEHAAGRRRPGGAARTRCRRCSTSSWASTRRCRRRASSTSRACCATARRICRPRRASRSPRHASAGRARRSTARSGTGRRTRTRARRAGRSTSACACSRRSIRSSGTGAASSCSGAGPIASRPTRRQPKRTLGYYALPLLWRDAVIGWGNAAVKNGRLTLETHFVAGAPPRDAALRSALKEERARLAEFLGL